MNVSELVDVVSTKTGSTKTSTREILTTALDTIRNQVREGDRVSIVGFGAFFKAERQARIGRNPQTGEQVRIAATKIPRFKPGKEFKLLVKGTKAKTTAKKSKRTR